MDYVRRYKLKQLIDELDDAEFNRLVEVLRSSELQFPGWKDRLAPTEAPECKSGGQLSFSADLVDFVRGSNLALSVASNFRARYAPESG